MGGLRPTTRRLLLVLAIVIGGAAVRIFWLSGYVEECPHLSLGQRLLAAALQGTSVVRFHSESCQDRWIALEVFPGLRKGYFVDVGSADGVALSNTKALESLGWKGVCIDPFPKNMSDRRCTVFTTPVYSTSGKRVRFRIAGNLGGIEANLGRWRVPTESAPVVELETRTLTELLAQAKAPPFIHYMSMDIEGAELEALKGLDFSRYRFGAMTIEHNFEEPKRSEIRRLLESNGYRYVRTVAQDDYYVGGTEGG